jgi:hypothetical protein
LIVSERVFPFCPETSDDIQIALDVAAREKDIGWGGPLPPCVVEVNWAAEAD